MMRLCFLLQRYPMESCLGRHGAGAQSSCEISILGCSHSSAGPATCSAFGSWLDQTNCNQCHAVLAIPETGMTQISRIPELCLASTTSCKVNCVFSMRERKRKLFGPFYFAWNYMAESQFQPAQCQSFLWEWGQSRCGQRSQRGSSVTTEQSKRVHWGISTQAEQTPTTSCICEIQLHHVL